MSIVSMNSQTLSQDTGHEVPEIYVVIAKHEVLGLDTKTVAESIGATVEEVEEVQGDRIYQDILILLRAEHAKSKVDSDLSWDAIEETALERLFKRVQNESDGEFLLKVAAVANRATRRTAKKVDILDPSQHGVRVPLTLTRRITERFNGNGTKEIERSEQLSISDGSMVNPSFKEVDDFLHVSARPALPKEIDVKTVNHDPSVDDLMQDMKDGGFLNGKG